MKKLASEGQLVAYEFDGFWQCMDTKREMDKLNDMIEEGGAPCMVWDKKQNKHIEEEGAFFYK